MESKQEMIYVVVDHEEQYSIWPANRGDKRGWRDAGKTGTLDECHKHIRRIWKDMRPLSLRREMGDA